MDKSKKLEIIKDTIKSYPNFPKSGIIYKDVFPIFQDMTALRALRDLLVEHVAFLNVDVLVGLDSRGFLVGALIALDVGKPFVPIRKKGKLPGKLVGQTFHSEYGEGSLEMQINAIPKGKHVVILDDVLATGGTMQSAVKLVKSAGAEVVECVVIVELTSLHGRDKIRAPVHSFVKYKNN